MIATAIHKENGGIKLRKFAGPIFWSCPNCFFHRWNVTSEMFASRQITWIVRSPRSASRRTRILSSVVYRLPFIVWSFHGRPRLTNQVVQLSRVTSHPQAGEVGRREAQTAGTASRQQFADDVPAHIRQPMECGLFSRPCGTCALRGG